MKSPAGAAENPGVARFCRPGGAWFVLTIYPQLKLRAIFGRRSVTFTAIISRGEVGHVQAILHFAFSFNGQHLIFAHGAFTKGD
jgi:hypothetical protein